MSVITVEKLTVRIGRRSLTTQYHVHCSTCTQFVATGGDANLRAIVRRIQTHRCSDGSRPGRFDVIDHTVPPRLPASG